jgi:hypothetical protein
MVVIMSVRVRLIVVGMIVGIRMVAVVVMILTETVGKMIVGSVVSIETLIVLLAVTTISGIVALMEMLGVTVGINFCVTVANSV